MYRPGQAKSSFSHTVDVHIQAKSLRFGELTVVLAEGCV